MGAFAVMDTETNRADQGLPDSLPRPDIRQFFGKTVHVVIDRPLGFCHHGLIDPVNYGYLPGVIAGDGEEQDAYILGISVPLREFDGVVIGAAVRNDDCEDKLIIAPEGLRFSPEQVKAIVHFQEQFFDSRIILP